MKRSLICMCVLFGLAMGCEEAPQLDAAGQTGQAVPDAMTATGALDFRQVVQAAKARVFPATVFVLVLQESYESGRRVTSEISGSGVIISPTGEVVTNWHVVDKAVEIRCLLYDGTPMDATVIGSDKDTDLALIQLTVPDDFVGELAYAVMGDSDALNEGDFVMAMGAPWGLSRSVSIGIISCRDRYLQTNSEYSLWLQTDASISPGNSGGPLVNTDGEVVGINTRGIVRGGDVGFAVPSATVEMIVNQLREHGSVNWSWTGLRLQPLKDFNRNIYFEGDDGVIVAATDPASPARAAGVLPQDRIIAINGEPITGRYEENLPAVRLWLAMLPKHEEALLTIRRNGEEIELTMTPREKGEVEGEELDCPRWNMTVKEINQFDNEDLYFYHTEGVFIYGIRRPGNAADARLREKDIILDIEGEPIATLEDVLRIYEEAIANIETSHRIRMVVLRNGHERQVVLDFSKDYERD